MTREKLAPGTVLQKAYGILDKYKLSRTFFVKTDQNSCEIAEAQPPQHQQAQGNEPSAAPAAPAGVQNDSAATANGNKKPGKKGVQQKKGAQTTGRDEGAAEGESAVKVEKEKEKEKDTVASVHHHIKEQEPVVAVGDQKAAAEAAPTTA